MSDLQSAIQRAHAMCENCLQALSDVYLGALVIFAITKSVVMTVIFAVSQVNAMEFNIRMLARAAN